VFDAISQNLRSFIAARAGHICEYCRAHADYFSTPFSVEHIVPKSLGGSNLPDNLAYACQGCNNIKFTKTTGIDPETSIVVPLFNPRIHVWEQHFIWDSELLHMVGLTPVGRASIDALKLNRIELCNLRAILFLIGVHPAKYN